VKAILKTGWKLSFGPIYQSLFRRYFQAMLSRQDTALGELGALKAQIQALNAAVVNEVARGEALRVQVATLDLQVRNALAARWDDAALGRRLAGLEDRMRDAEQVGNGADPAAVASDSP
jgi:hypothetical protein